MLVWILFAGLGVMMTIGALIASVYDGAYRPTVKQRRQGR